MASLNERLIEGQMEAHQSTGYCRVDLVGGTTDLWPLYCHLGGVRVINLAIPVAARVELTFEKQSTFSLKITSRELGIKSKHTSMAALKKDVAASVQANPLRWVHRLCLHTLQRMGVTDGHWTLAIQSDAPPGSGLGGSSVLGVVIVKAFFDLQAEPITAWALHDYVVNLEAAEIEKPAGEQDAIPALFGGLCSFYLSADIKSVDHYDDPIGDELADRSALIHTGKPHHSGINNWDVYKKFHEGNKKVRGALAGIRDLAEEMHGHLLKGELEKFIAAVNREWALRKKLSPTFDVPVLSEAWAFAKKSGAVARKACGAGGGGSLLVIFASKADRDAAMKRTLPQKSWLWITLRCQKEALFPTVDLY